MEALARSVDAVFRAERAAMKDELRDQLRVNITAEVKAELRQELKAELKQELLRELRAELLNEIAVQQVQLCARLTAEWASALRGARRRATHRSVEDLDEQEPNPLFGYGDGPPSAKSSATANRQPAAGARHKCSTTASSIHCKAGSRPTNSSSSG